MVKKYGKILSLFLVLAILVSTTGISVFKRNCSHEGRTFVSVFFEEKGECCSKDQFCHIPEEHDCCAKKDDADCSLKKKQKCCDTEYLFIKLSERYVVEKVIEINTIKIKLQSFLLSLGTGLGNGVEKRGLPIFRPPPNLCQSTLFSLMSLRL